MANKPLKSLSFSGLPDAYTVPNPVEKTAAMTQPVGVDSDGKLYTEPGSGGGGESTLAWLPTVDTSGNISWAQSTSTVAPTARNIKGPQGPQGPQGPAGETGPQGPQGQKGNDGSDGEDGHSPVISATKSGGVTTIKADGTTIATINDGADGADGQDGAQGPQGIQGPQGPSGTNGQDGYTPVRGTDYWTAADIATIKGYVDDAILGGEW